MGYVTFPRAWALLSSFVITLVSDIYSQPEAHTTEMCDSFVVLLVVSKITGDEVRAALGMVVRRPGDAKSFSFGFGGDLAGGWDPGRGGTILSVSGAITVLEVGVPFLLCIKFSAGASVVGDDTERGIVCLLKSLGGPLEHASSRWV